MADDEAASRGWSWVTDGLYDMRRASMFAQHVHHSSLMMKQVELPAVSVGALMAGTISVGVHIARALSPPAALFIVTHAVGIMGCGLACVMSVSLGVHMHHKKELAAHEHLATGFLGTHACCALLAARHGLTPLHLPQTCTRMPLTCALPRPWGE